MRKKDRYDTADLDEDQYEPGSDGQVLRNRLDLTSKDDMDAAEATALVRTMDALVRTYDDTHRVTATDLCDWNRLWLGDIYANGPGSIGG